RRIAPRSTGRASPDRPRRRARIPSAPAASRNVLARPERPHAPRFGLRTAPAPYPAVVMLLVDQADVAELGWRCELVGLRRAKLAYAVAKRRCDLLERRQVVAPRQRARAGGFLGLGGELQRDLAGDPAAPDDVLHAGREVAELVLLGVE